MSKATDNIKITPASQKALEMATRYGLTLTSGYRSPEHDKRVGGSGRGDHTKGQAYDFAGSFADMKQFATWAHKTGNYKQVIFENKDYATGRYIGAHMDHMHIAWYGNKTEWTEPKDSIVQLFNFGALIEVIQKLLGGLKIDGYYGSKTEQAVKEFQEKNNLSVDGIVGSETWNKLTNGGGFFFSHNWCNSFDGKTKTEESDHRGN